jgi:hypothetical protein
VAIFYRGAGVGTYWHMNDGRLSGLTPTSPGMMHSTDRVIQHVYNGLTQSPYVSLSCSYSVALNYAMEAGMMQPTALNPAYVYEVEINDTHRVHLIDPVKEVAAGAPNPLDSHQYQHNGHPNVLLGVVWALLAPLLRVAVVLPPGAATSATHTVNIGPHLWAIVAALRDAEILAIGTIPAACIAKRHSVY